MRVYVLFAQTNKCQTFLEFFCYMLFLVDRELRKSFVSICAAEFFHDRTEVQCLHRWQKVLNPELIKGPWTQEVCNCSFDFTFREKKLLHFSSTPNFQGKMLYLCPFLQEDDKIIDLVRKYGPTKWSIIAKSLPGRIGKQCRERYSSDHGHIVRMVNIILNTPSN